MSSRVGAMLVVDFLANNDSVILIEAYMVALEYTTSAVTCVVFDTLSRL